MPTTNNTLPMSTWTTTTKHSDAEITLLARYSSPARTRSLREAKDVLQADIVIQFIKHLVANDPDFRDKFTAFRVATRIGAVP
jgi:hypothetical protein